MKIIVFMSTGTIFWRKDLSPKLLEVVRKLGEVEKSSLFFSPCAFRDWVLCEQLEEALVLLP